MALAHTKAPVRYKYVTEEKADGATFTPKRLASFVAEQIVLTLPVTKTAIRVLDPAVGEGALLLSLLEQLRAHGMRDIEIHGFDTNPESLVVAEEAIRARFPLVPVRFRVGDFLEYAGQFANSLPIFGGGLPVERFDAIIANPPYVRTQIMGAAHAQSLAAHFGLSGRVDLYHAFILGIIEVLEDNGVAGVIVSNRFMTTKSGSAVRKVLREAVLLKHVWDLGDTKLFDAAVLPAVILFTKSASPAVANPGFTSIYETDGAASGSARDVIAALAESGAVSLPDARRFEVTQGSLDLSTAVEEIWRVATEKTDAWLKTVADHTWRTWGEIGSIRVGVKTCADKVFIRSDWDSMGEHERPELLRPLTTHHMGRRFKADAAKAGRQVLYPHQVNGGQREVADLARYPGAAAYLEKHRPTLEGRSYVLEAGRRWYEIWVPQDPGMWGLPKLVFRDICETPTFWIDLEGSVVNGDCYWLALNPGGDIGLLWLALAVANSSFIEAFYDHRFHNKLYAGRRRFITQYVEKFPLPDPSRAESIVLADLARQVYDLTPSPAAKELETRLDGLVWQAFGVGQSKNSAGSRT
ncbi:MAG: N-6 DNA methylase [Terriglobia bacterium]|jgi:methylase of polypeptide subunit release factors